MKNIRTLFVLCVFVILISIGCTHYSTIRRPAEENIINAPVWVVWNKLVIDPMVLREAEIPITYVDGISHTAIAYKQPTMWSCGEKIEVILRPITDKQTRVFIEGKKLNCLWGYESKRVKKIFARLKEESEKTPNELPKGFWDYRRYLNRMKQMIEKKLISFKDEIETKGMTKEQKSNLANKIRKYTNKYQEVLKQIEDWNKEFSLRLSVARVQEAQRAQRMREESLRLQRQAIVMQGVMAGLQFYNTWMIQNQLGNLNIQLNNINNSLNNINNSLRDIGRQMRWGY